MIRNAFRWCLPLLSTILLSPTTFAQETSKQTTEAPSAVPYYALALVGALIVLVVVFKPSNKDW